MKKSITALTLAILLALTGVSCGNNGNSDETTTGGDTGTTSPETEKDIYDDLPTGDYGGETVTILNNSVTWAEYRIDSDEINGDSMNDAVYQRTKFVEDKLKVEIELIEQDLYSGTAGYLANLVLAGDDSIDASFIGAMYNVANISKGIYIDLNDVNEFDFSKPWWDTNSMKYYEIENKLYMAHNETSANFHDTLWVGFFNKKLFDTLKLDDIYSVVRDGKWTIDKLKEYIEVGQNDLDGDGELGADDQWGLMTHSGAGFGFLHAANERGVDIKDGIPFVSPVDDRMFDVITKIRSVFDMDGVMTNDKLRDKLGFHAVEGFAAGKSLLLIEVIGNAKTLRAMDADFGIIPFPKYEESQENYIAYFSPATNAFSIPKTTKDLSRTATVIENLSAYGYKTVRPAYYDIVLHGKTVRDEESREMLDIIFSNIEGEMTYIYNWGGYASTLKSVLSGSGDIVSSLESKKTAVETAIENYLKDLQ